MKTLFLILMALLGNTVLCAQPAEKVMTVEVHKTEIVNGVKTTTDSRYTSTNHKRLTRNCRMH